MREVAKSNLLSDAQHEAIRLLLQLTPKGKICEILRIDDGTLWRWQQLPEFRSHLQRCREAVDAAVVAMCSGLSEHMILHQVAIAKNPNYPPKDRLKAASNVVELGLKIKASLREDAKAGTGAGDSSEQDQAAAIRRAVAEMRAQSGVRYEPPPPDQPAPPGGPADA